MSKSRFICIAALTLGGLVVCQLNAATIVGPSPYLTLADVPVDFTAAGGGSPLSAQDFEAADGPWETGFTISGGRRIGPNHVSGAGPVTDSVDGDDSTVDGNGLMGASWYIPSRSATITFDTPARAAGFVLTDADPLAKNFLMQAYDSDGNMLVAQNFQFDDAYMDEFINGTTAEDRFFGVVPVAGGHVKSITIGIDDGAGIEIDHVQNFQVPEPATAVLLLLSLAGLALLRHRR